MSGRIPEICVAFLGLFCKSKCFQSTFWIMVSGGGFVDHSIVKGRRFRGYLCTIIFQSQNTCQIYLPRYMLVQIKCSCDSRGFQCRIMSIPYKTMKDFIQEVQSSPWTQGKHTDKFHRLHLLDPNRYRILCYGSLWGFLNPMLGIHPSLNTCNLKTLSLVDWWTRPTHLKKKTSQMQGIFDESYHQLSSGVYRTPFSAPKISEMQKCKKKKNSNSFGLGWTTSKIS